MAADDVSIGFQPPVNEAVDWAFPSCSIEEDDVSRCLASVAHGGTIHRVDSNDLRSGYTGMIVATGRAGRP